MVERFPTLGPGETRYHAFYPGPPIHPQPGIYETTLAEVDGRPITHADIEPILRRPSWDFEEANLRIFRENRDHRNRKAKKAAKKSSRRTPQQQPKGTT